MASARAVVTDITDPFANAALLIGSIVSKYATEREPDLLRIKF